MDNKNKTFSIRACDNFEPQKFILSTEDEAGIDTQYLPAYARILWFNAYQAEKNILMALTTERITDSDPNLIIYRATLKQYFGCHHDGTMIKGVQEPIGVIIATAEASGVRGDSYGFEGVETKAQARCLRIAGFNVNCEGIQDLKESSFADAPIIPDQIKKTNPVPITDSHQEDNNSAANTQLKFDENSSSNIDMSAPPIRDIKDIFPDLVSNTTNGTSGKQMPQFDDLSDKDKLKICLNECFYPWQEKNFNKGDLTKDICLKPNFIEKLKWIVSDEYTGNGEITSGVTIKKWGELLLRYLTGNQAEKQLLLDVLKNSN